MLGKGLKRISSRKDRGREDAPNDCRIWLLSARDWEPNSGLYIQEDRGENINRRGHLKEPGQNLRGLKRDLGIKMKAGLRNSPIWWWGGGKTQSQFLQANIRIKTTNPPERE